MKKQEDERCSRDERMASCWHVVETFPMAERKAAAALSEAGFGVYLPVARSERQHRRTKAWRTVEAPLFPGYVIVEVPPDPDAEYWRWSMRPTWRRLSQCAGVMWVLGIERDDGVVMPLPISGRLVERLMAAQLNLEFDDTREAQIARGERGRNRKETARILFRPGMDVRVGYGPFASFLATVERVTGRGEVEATVALMGRTVLATFQPEALDRIAA